MHVRLIRECTVSAGAYGANCPVRPVSWHPKVTRRCARDLTSAGAAPVSSTFLTFIDGGRGRAGRCPMADQPSDAHGNDKEDQITRAAPNKRKATLFSRFCCLIAARAVPWPGYN